MEYKFFHDFSSGGSSLLNFSLPTILKYLLFHEHVIFSFISGTFLYSDLPQSSLPPIKPFLGWPLEKEMATHAGVPAWRIPGTGEPGGLPSMGSHSRTRLKWLSSSRLAPVILRFPCQRQLLQERASYPPLHYYPALTPCSQVLTLLTLFVCLISLSLTYKLVKSGDNLIFILLPASNTTHGQVLT